MSVVLQPWQLLLSIVAGWIDDEQQKIIEYQRTIIQVLQEKNGNKRTLLNDDQRRRLAVQGKVLGRNLLSEIGTFFTPDCSATISSPLRVASFGNATEQK